MLNLRDAGDAHAKLASDFPLSHARFLARVSQLGTARKGEHPACARLDLGRRHAGGVQLALKFCRARPTSIPPPGGP